MRDVANICIADGLCGVQSVIMKESADEGAYEGDLPELNHPWLVAVWPGMGNVAVSAGYYLMAKLGMHQLAEFSTRELFDLDHIEVKDGLIKPARQPRSRFYVWKDPQNNHDIVAFIGEAQPPTGKYLFCLKLIDFAKQLGVERVLTFAAMATEMHPESDARVFGVATDHDGLDDLQRLELVPLEDGRISGLNGLLLGLAAEHHLPGVCLLGEMPHIFSQLPFPKASLAVLEAFTAMARIELDVTELAKQAKEMEQQLGSVLAQIEKAILQRRAEQGKAPEEWAVASAEDKESEAPSGPTPEDRQRIEALFEQAKKDRSKAYKLKADLDRLNVFEEFEDRFLDLFQDPD